MVCFSNQKVYSLRAGPYLIHFTNIYHRPIKLRFLLEVWYGDKVCGKNYPSSLRGIDGWWSLPGPQTPKSGLWRVDAIVPADLLADVTVWGVKQTGKCHENKGWGQLGWQPQILQRITISSEAAYDPHMSSQKSPKEMLALNPDLNTSRLKRRGTMSPWSYKLGYYWKSSIWDHSVRWTILSLNQNETEMLISRLYLTSWDRSPNVSALWQDYRELWKPARESKPI